MPAHRAREVDQQIKVQRAPRCESCAAHCAALLTLCRRRLGWAIPGCTCLTTAQTLKPSCVVWCVTSRACARARAVGPDDMFLFINFVCLFVLVCVWLYGSLSGVSSQCAAQPALHHQALPPLPAQSGACRAARACQGPFAGLNAWRCAHACHHRCQTFEVEKVYLRTSALGVPHVPAHRPRAGSRKRSGSFQSALRLALRAYYV